LSRLRRGGDGLCYRAAGCNQTNEVWQKSLPRALGRRNDFADQPMVNGGLKKS